MAVIPIAGALLALLAVVFQFALLPRLTVFGVLNRTLENKNNGACDRIPELQGCEDMWLHQETGYLYAACSDPLTSRMAWLPCQDRLDWNKAPPTTDYIAVVDTRASGHWSDRIRKITPKNFPGVQVNGKPIWNLHGISVHVVDPVLPGSKPTLKFFLVNHRPPVDALGRVDAAAALKSGANSTVELFTTTVGSDEFEYEHTYAHPEIRTPNSIAATGKDSFIFTNDHGAKVGHGRALDLLLARSNAGFCDKKGCKSALSPLPFPNGITNGAKDKEYWIASTSDGTLRQVELQADGSLVLLDEVKTGYPMDNLRTDSNGHVWAASFPKLLQILPHFEDPVNVHSPVHVMRLRLNDGKDAFYGQKYTVDHVFEDAGFVASGITVVVHDTDKRKLFMGGVQTPYSLACDI